MASVNITSLAEAIKLMIIMIAIIVDPSAKARELTIIWKNILDPDHDLDQHQNLMANL